MGRKTHKQVEATTLIHPQMIKASIRIEYGSVEKFEAAKGLGHHSVYDVLRGRTVHRTAVALATFMGVPVAKLFPGRFIDSGCKSQKPDAQLLNSKAA